MVFPTETYFKARFWVREEERSKKKEERRKRKERRRKKKEERADRNRSNSTIARTGTFAVRVRGNPSLRPCHPRTWNLKNEHDFSVARSGSSWLRVARNGIFEKRPRTATAAHCFSTKWHDSGFEWLGLVRHWLFENAVWLEVARSGS